MKSIRLTAVAAASLALGTAAPALAQSEYPVTPGEYVDMSMVTIDDGHSLDYAKFLAGQWRKEQEYAKSQGWITGYEVLTNVDKRVGEPDLYLVVRFASLPDGAEDQRREAAYYKYMSTSTSQMEQAAGARASYRHVLGSMLLRKLDFKR